MSLIGGRMDGTSIPCIWDILASFLYSGKKWSGFIHLDIQSIVNTEQSDAVWGGACLLILSGTGRDTLSLISNTLSSGSDAPLKVGHLQDMYSVPYLGDLHRRQFGRLALFNQLMVCQKAEATDTPSSSSVEQRHPLQTFSLDWKGNHVNRW